MTPRAIAVVAVVAVVAVDGLDGAAVTVALQAGAS
jgi:hypothetical protein